MTPRRILLLLIFGVPALGLLSLLGYVIIAGPPEALLQDKTEATPAARWVGATRPAQACPEFYGTGRELFELSRIRDSASLRAREHSREVAQVGRQRIALREVSFVSYEMQGCEVAEVELHGLLAMPVGSEKNRSGRLAGIVRMHGLLPHEERRDVLELAAGLKAAVLALYSPGFERSQGWDSRPDHYFDTASDPRRSWQWSQAMALMRGLTFFEARPEVDAERLATIGYSSGGMAALIAAGTDPRVKATVAWSGTGFLDLAVKAEPVPGWHVALLEGMNPARTVESPEWKGFVRTLDPKNFLDSVTSPVFLINGAQDQYFPTNATVRTFEALLARSDEHRLHLLTGYDHGPIADKLITRLRPIIMSNVLYWFGHHLRLEEGFRERVPVPKVVSVLPAECCPAEGCRVCARVQIELPRATQYEVDEVAIHISTDSARSFSSREAEPEGSRTFVATVSHLSPDDVRAAVYFAEVTYRPLGQVTRIRVSSSPRLPESFVPRIWPDARLR